MQNRRKLILALTVVFTLNIMIIALAQRADAVTYARGSSGETVRQIQEKLLDWGYYSGEVDGVFGSKTEEAVEYFQKKNGLAVDGKVGPETLAALGMSTGETSSASGTRPGTLRCSRGSSLPRQGANPTPGRSRSVRSCSIGSSTRRSQIRSQR